MKAILFNPYTNIHSQSIMQFENGYGLSIIKLINSSNVGCVIYEVAVIKFNSAKIFSIIYPPFMKGDVARCNSYQEVEKLIAQTRELK